MNCGSKFSIAGLSFLVDSGIYQNLRVQHHRFRKFGRFLLRLRKALGEKAIGSAEQKAQNLILDAENKSETIRKDRKSTV